MLQDSPGFTQFVHGVSGNKEAVSATHLQQTFHFMLSTNFPIADTFIKNYSFPFWLMDCSPIKMWYISYNKHFILCYQQISLLTQQISLLEIDLF